MSANPAIADSDAEVVTEATADGQADFDFDFPIYAVDQIAVYIGATLKTLTTHYTVDGVENADGGTVTLTPATAATISEGQEVTIRRVTPIVRTSKYQQTGDFRSYTVNRDLDLLTMIAQEERRETDAAVASIIAEAIARAQAVSAEASRAGLAESVLQSQIDALILNGVSMPAVYRGRPVGEKLGDVVSLRDYSDYGAAADFDYAEAEPNGSNNRAAILQAIAELSDGDTIKLDPGYSLVTGGALPTDKLINYIGGGTFASHLVIQGSAAFQLDFSARPETEFAMTIAQMSVISLDRELYDAFEITGLAGDQGGQCPRLIMSDINLLGADRPFDNTIVWDGETLPQQLGWKTGVRLNSCERAVLRNIWMRGKNTAFDDAYDTDTKIVVVDASTGVELHNVRGQRIKESVYYTGQSEGLLVQGCAFAAVQRGIVASGLEAPANASHIHHTHISADLCNIDIEATTGGGGSQGWNIHNNYLLQRTQAAGTEGFRHIRACINSSAIIANQFESSGVAGKAKGNAAIELLGPHRKVKVIGNDGLDCGILFKNSRNDGTSSVATVIGNSAHGATDPMVITVTDHSSVLGDVYAGNVEIGTQQKLTGTAQAGTATTLRLPAIGSSAFDGFYDGLRLRLNGGTGAGQVRSVIDYDGATLDVTVPQTFNPVPDNTTTFILELKTQPTIQSNNANSHDFSVGGGRAVSIPSATIADIRLRLLAGTIAQGYATLSAQDGANAERPINFANDIWRAGVLLLTAPETAWAIPTGTLARTELDDTSDAVAVRKALMALITDLMAGKLPR